MSHGAQPFEHNLHAKAEFIPTNDGLHLFGWCVAFKLSGPRLAAVLQLGWGDKASNLMPAAVTLNEAG